MAPKGKGLKKKKVPTSVTEWKNSARAWGAFGAIKDLGSQEKVKSASRFEFRHFLGLRVIYEDQNPKSTLPVYINNQFPPATNAGLESLDGWNAYLNKIEEFADRNETTETVSRTCVPMNLGAFLNVWQFQRHVLLGDNKAADVSKISEVSPIASRTRAKTEKNLYLATPTPAEKVRKSSLSDLAAKLSIKNQDVFAKEAEEVITDQREEIEEEGTAKRLEILSESELEASSEEENIDEDPKDGFYTPIRGSRGQLIRDEQTVNVFLLALLSAITAATVPFHTRWLAERNAMVFQKNVQYVARTDGHLRKKNGQSSCLIEVKPRPRRRPNDVSIRVQESAQMAAWISQHGVKSHNPEKDCSIFLLSQDKDEIYLTFPHFTEAYGKDDKNMADLKDTDFLRMRESALAYVESIILDRTCFAFWLPLFTAQGGASPPEQEVVNSHSGNASRAASTIPALQKQYNASTRLYDTTGRWNSASAQGEPVASAVIEPALNTVANQGYPIPDGVAVSAYTNLSLEVATFLQPPFSIIKGKSDTGSEAEAEHQGCRGGATPLNAARQLREKIGAPDGAAAGGVGLILGLV